MQVILTIQMLGMLLSPAACTIGGLSYMDPIDQRPYQNPLPPREDPCNPLYWYPRNIPNYCFLKSSAKVVTPEPLPIPLPIPVPLPPQHIPMPIPPLPSSVPIPSGPMPFPQFISPPMPLPYGLPIVPASPVLPVAGVPYPPIHQSYPFQISYKQQASMIPGLPGVVSPNGGINILPFSDAYSDMLEKQKQKIIRKRLQKLLDKYEGYPTRNHRRHKKCRRPANNATQKRLSEIENFIQPLWRGFEEPRTYKLFIGECCI